LGAPEEIRTPDPQIRSLVLYPAELRARFSLGILGLRARTHSGTGPEGREERFSYPLRLRLASAGSASGGAILGIDSGMVRRTG
jgi:hypothetical protein